jgi:hypothetical protein
VLAKTSARLTSAEFVDFLAQIVESQPADREIHVIAGNLSEDKPRKFALLEASPTVRIHCIPTYDRIDLEQQVANNSGLQLRFNAADVQYSNVSQFDHSNPQSFVRYLTKVILFGTKPMKKIAVD